MFIFFFFFFFFNDTATTEIYTLSLHDALPISDLALEIAGRVVLVHGGHHARKRYARVERPDLLRDLVSRAVEIRGRVAVLVGFRSDVAVRVVAARAGPGRRI